MILTICILSGCRTAPKAKYSLITADGLSIAGTLGNGQENTVPQKYMVGVSGMLVVSYLERV